MTDNLRDFPEWKLPGKLHALAGIEFLGATIEVNPAHAALELEVMARRRDSELGELIEVMATRFGSVPSFELLKPYA